MRRLAVELVSPPDALQDGGVDPDLQVPVQVVEPDHRAGRDHVRVEQAGQRTVTDRRCHHRPVAEQRGAGLRHRPGLPDRGRTMDQDEPVATEGVSQPAVRRPPRHVRQLGTPAPGGGPRLPHAERLQACPARSGPPAEVRTDRIGLQQRCPGRRAGTGSPYPGPQQTEQGDRQRHGSQVAGDDGGGQVLLVGGAGMDPAHGQDHRGHHDDRPGAATASAAELRLGRPTLMDDECAKSRGTAAHGQVRR